MTAAVRPQTGLKRLAGALGTLCLVLFLLAIEQSHAISAWRALRDDAMPVAGRMVDWARALPSGAADGLTGLRTAVAEVEAPLAASPGPHALTGEYLPADELTRERVGGVTFVGATVVFEAGETLRTQPLHMATGRDSFAPGQTFADRLNALPDAQIELRRVLPAAEAKQIAPSGLCAGRAPGILAILHRRDRVDLMLFRNGGWIAPTSPASDLCGVWSFHAR